MDRTRRRVLATAAALPLPFTGGCVSDGEPTPGSPVTDTETPRESTTSDATVLHLKIVNGTGEAHEVGVTLRPPSTTPSDGDETDTAGATIVDREMTLAPSETLDLTDDRAQGESYVFTVVLRGETVLEETVEPYEGLTVRILGPATIDVNRVVL